MYIVFQFLRISLILPSRIYWPACTCTRTCTSRSSEAAPSETRSCPGEGKLGAGTDGRVAKCQGIIIDRCKCLENLDMRWLSEVGKHTLKTTWWKSPGVEKWHVFCNWITFPFQMGQVTGVAKRWQLQCYAPIAKTAIELSKSFETMTTMTSPGVKKKHYRDSPLAISLSLWRPIAVGWRRGRLVRSGFWRER